MPKYRGWRVSKGGVPAKGSRYSRYSSRINKVGVQYKDVNTGYVYSPSGGIIAYEPSKTKVMPATVLKSRDGTIKAKGKYYRVLR